MLPYRTGRTAHKTPGIRQGGPPCLPIQRGRSLPDATPPTDPAGAKPRRDHRRLARVSRHEVPKTPGYLCYVLYIRPRQGVAPSDDRHYERRPCGVEGMNKAMISRGRRGYAPPTTGLRKTHPYRGASCRLSHYLTSLPDESDSAGDTWDPPRMSTPPAATPPTDLVGLQPPASRPTQPADPAGDPDRGATALPGRWRARFLFSRGKWLILHCRSLAPTFLPLKII